MPRTILVGLIVALCWCPAAFAQAPAHVWERQEIELRAERPYGNPYAQVECRIDLKGPGLSTRVYGFWDGGDVFRVRFVATAPGEWTWTSGSNQPADAGLNGKRGGFEARDWTEEEKRQNPNRRGFLRPDSKDHALQYADGTPFFLLGDTWLGAATWRLPLTDAPADPGYQAEPGVTFQQAVALRKRQGFNSVSMIAAFPTWASDQYPGTYADRKGIYYRNAWEAFGIIVPGDKPTAKAMHDERGYRPFEMMPGSEGLPDYDRVVPAFFHSLDLKVQHLSDQGFVAMLETIRRDVAPPWKAYFDFNESYARFLQYMVARYGAYDVTSAAEPPGARPYFWQALRYESADYMRGLGTFVLSEGARYRDLELASDDRVPRKAAGSSGTGLDGWSFLMRTPDRGFGLLYFENRAARARTTGWRPSTRYRLAWFDPRAGRWREPIDLVSDGGGGMQLPPFPDGQDVAGTDWAAKIVMR
jgi:hypothetical protein